MSLSSVWSGRPKISEIVVTHPVLYLPMLRDRLPNADASPAALAPDMDGATIDRFKITDGEVAFSRVRDRVDSHITAINADAVMGRDRMIKVTGTARISEHPARFDIKATTSPPVERQAMPVDFVIDMRARTLIGNPAHGGEHVYELY